MDDAPERELEPLIRASEDAFEGRDVSDVLFFNTDSVASPPSTEPVAECDEEEEEEEEEEEPDEQQEEAARSAPPEEQPGARPEEPATAAMMQRHSSFEGYEEERRVHFLKQQLKSRIAKDMGKDPDEVLMVAVSGSATFMNEFWTPPLCEAIGKKLAETAGPNVAIVTGGMKGVGESVAKAFADKRRDLKQRENTYMVLPTSDPEMEKFVKKAPTKTNDDGTVVFKEWDFGATVFLGNSVKEREALMGEIPVIILMEGGPGAWNEANIAVENHRSVIPIAVTGGAAGNRLNMPECPDISFSLPNMMEKECAHDWSVVRNAMGTEYVEGSITEAEKDKRVAEIAESASCLVKSLYTEKILIQGQALKGRIAKGMDKDPAEVMLVGIIGSVTFYDKTWTEKLCKALGQQLAIGAGDSMAIITGGMYGVGEHVARSFAETRKANANKENTYMLLPENEPNMKEYMTKAPTEQDADGKRVFRPWEFGETLFVGESVKDRETLLASVTPVLIMLEGGPGAEKEATMAVKNEHIVIPISITGGGAKNLRDKVGGPIQHLLQESKNMKDSWEIVRTQPLKKDEVEKLEKAKIEEMITEIAEAASSLVTAIHSSKLKERKKPMAVISCSPSDALKRRVEEILEGLGFDHYSSSHPPDSGGEQGDRLVRATRKWLDKASSPETKVIIFLLSKDYVRSPAYENEFKFIMQDRMASIALPVVQQDIRDPTMQFFLQQVHHIEVGNAPVGAALNDDGISPQDMTATDDGGSWELLFKLSVMLTAERVLRFRDDTEAMSILLKQHRATTSGRNMPTGEDSAGKDNRAQQHLENLLREHLLLEISKDMDQNREDILLVGISGSTKFNNTHWSKEICEEIGREMAQIAGENVALVTGGFKGIGEAIARSFAKTRTRNKQKAHTYMVLPWGETNDKFKEHGCGYENLANGAWRFKEWDFGKTLFVGQTVEQRERVLSVCPVMIIVEGGPGARAEVTHAIQDKRHVIPIAVTGGTAGDGTVEFEFPEEIAQSVPVEYSKLKEAWDIVMDKRGTNGEGLRTKLQREGKVKRIQKIAHSTGLLVSTILKYNVDGSSPQSLHDPSETTASQTGNRNSFRGSPRRSIQNRPKDLENICRRSLQVSSRSDRLHARQGTSSSMNHTDNEQRLFEYLEELRKEYHLPEDKLVPMYIMNGHRGNTKFANDDWKAQVDTIANVLDDQHGSSKDGENGANGDVITKGWLCIYAGDPYIEGEADVAHVAAHLRDRGVRVIAFLPDKYKRNVLEPRDPKAYKHLRGGGVYFHPTEWVQATLNADTDGQRVASKRRPLFGGRHPQNGSLCGASKIFFDLLEQHIEGHILVGGGSVSRDDYRECFKLGIPVHYIQAKMAFKSTEVPKNDVWHATYKLPPPELELSAVYGEYGVIHSYHMFYRTTTTTAPNTLRGVKTVTATKQPESCDTPQPANEVVTPSSIIPVDMPSAAAQGPNPRHLRSSLSGSLRQNTVRRPRRNQVAPEPHQEEQATETVEARDVWTAARKSVAEQFLAMHQTADDLETVKPGGIGDADKLLVEGTVKFMAQATKQCTDGSQHLTTISTKGVVQVWNLETGKEDPSKRVDLRLMIPEDSEDSASRPNITAVQFFEDSDEFEHIVIGCEDGNAYLWAMHNLLKAEEARKDEKNKEKQERWREAGRPTVFKDSGLEQIKILAVQGQKLVASDSRRVCIWDLSNPRAPPADFERRAAVQCLCLSRGKRENKMLFTGGEDGSLLVFDIAAQRDKGEWSACARTGARAGAEHVREGRAHAENLSAMCATPDGELLVTGGSDKYVRVWSLETGRVLREIRLPDERADKPDLKLPVAVNAMCVIPQQARLAVGFTIGRGAGSQGVVFVYDLAALTRSKCLAMELSAGKHVNPGHVNLLCPSVDGRALFSHHRRVMASKNKNSFDRIWKWDIDPCNEALRLKGKDQGLGAICPLPCGMFATSCREKMCVLDTEGRRILLSSNKPREDLGPVTCMAVHNLGQDASSLLFAGHKGGSITIWEVLAQPNLAIWEVVTDGSPTFLGSRAFSEGMAVTGLAVDPDGDRVYFVRSAGARETQATVYTWDLPEAQKGPLRKRWETACSSPACSDDAGKIDKLNRTGSYGQTYRAGKPSAAAPILTAGEGAAVCCLCACPVAGQRIVVFGMKDGKVWMQHSRKGREWHAELEGHSDRVNAVDFSKSGMRIASGSDDGTIRVWDAQTRTQVAMIEARAGMESFQSVRFDESGNWVVSGSESPHWSGPTCCVWDVATGSLIAGFDSEPELCRGAAFVPGNRRVVAACKHLDSVCVFDIDGQPGPLLGLASQSSSSNDENVLELQPDETLMKWDLSFTFTAVSKSRWQGGESSMVPSTLRVSQKKSTEGKNIGEKSTNFFLPLDSDKYKYSLELRLEERPGLGREVLVSVHAGDPVEENKSQGHEAVSSEAHGAEGEHKEEKRRCLFQCWLFDLPRGQRFGMLGSPFSLPPLHSAYPVLSSDGKGGYKSLIHHLAATKGSSERARLLARCGQCLPHLVVQDVPSLLNAVPSLLSLLWVEDGNGRIPLELLLEQAGKPDARFFADLMGGYKMAAEQCRSKCDLQALKRIMACCAYRMPKLHSLIGTLSLDSLWEMLDQYGAVVLEHIECRQEEKGKPFSKRVFYAPSALLRSPQGQQLDSSSSENGNRCRLMIITVPDLFTRFTVSKAEEAAEAAKQTGQETNPPKTPWEFIVDNVPTSRFSMPLIRGAVDFRQHTGGLNLIPWLLGGHCMVLLCCCALLYLHKGKVSRSDAMSLSPNLAEILLAAFLCLVASVILVQELRQMKEDWKRNIKDPWTWVDITLSGSIGGLTWAMAAKAEWYLCWLAFALVLCWFKLIGYMRSRPSTAGIVRMIMEVASKTRTYVAVLSLLIVGFSMANHTLVPSFIRGSGLWEMHVMLIRQIRFTLADFGIFEYELDDGGPVQAGTNESTPAAGLYMEEFSLFRGSYINYIALLVINLLFIYLVSIIMLNLLISVISEIYERVKEDELMALTQYRAKLDLELDALYMDLLANLKWRIGAASTPKADQTGCLLYVTLPEDGAETWVPSTESQTEGLRPLFRRIKDVKDSIGEKLDDAVVKSLRGEAESVREGLHQLRDDMEANFKKLFGADPAWRLKATLKAATESDSMPNGKATTSDNMPT